ncbi:MAG: hypothetical protein WC043_04255 [Pseudobdellovibrionaceae bacterium]
MVFIVSTLNDMKRVEQGLYHYPKLENAPQIRKAIAQAFSGEIDAAIDTNNDHVAYLVRDEVAGDDPDKLKSAVEGRMSILADAVRAVKAPQQPLEVRVKDVYTMALRDMDIWVPVLPLK